MTLADLSAFLFPMRTYLLAENERALVEFAERLKEKDTEIRRLRAELQSRGVRMVATEPQLTTIPWKQPLDPVPAGPQDWQGELTQLLKEEEEKPDGVPSE